MYIYIYKCIYLCIYKRYICILGGKPVPRHGGKLMLKKAHSQSKDNSMWTD